MSSNRVESPTPKPMFLPVEPWNTLTALKTKALNLTLGS